MDLRIARHQPYNVDRDLAASRAGHARYQWSGGESE